MNDTVFTVSNRQQRVRREQNDHRSSASLSDLGLNICRSAGILAGHLLNIQGGPLGETATGDTGRLLDDCLVKLCALANATGIVLDMNDEAENE